MAYYQTRLTRDLVVDAIISVHYFEYMKNFVFSGESHDFWEFLYVDKGTVRVRQGDRWITLDAGNIVFHRPGEFHAIRSIGRTSPNLVVVSFSCSSPAIMFFARKSFCLQKEERRLISRMILEARQAFSSPLNNPFQEKPELCPEPVFAAQQMFLLCLEQFLITLRRNHAQSDSTTAAIKKDSPEKEHTKSELFREIQYYMDRHVNEPLSVTQICAAFSVSRSALQALFHEKEHCGVIEYFNRQKIDRAKAMIREGRMNFTEIAYHLSYSSLPYFSKQFKKATGMSPMEYYSSVKGMSDALNGQDQ